MKYLKLLVIVALGVFVAFYAWDWLEKKRASDAFWERAEKTGQRLADERNGKLDPILINDIDTLGFTGVVSLDTEALSKVFTAGSDTIFAAPVFWNKTDSTAIVDQLIVSPEGDSLAICGGKTAFLSMTVDQKVPASNRAASWLASGKLEGMSKFIEDDIFITLINSNDCFIVNYEVSPFVEILRLRTICRSGLCRN